MTNCIVVKVMRWRYFHHACTKFTINIIIGNNRNFTIAQRQFHLFANEFFVAIIFRVNHHGDVAIPDHPLVQQTMRDCLTEAMDAEGLRRVSWPARMQPLRSGALRALPEP